MVGFKKEVTGLTIDLLKRDNRKAHEAAVRSRTERDILREDLKRGLSF